MSNIKCAIVELLACVFRLIQNVLFYRYPHRKPFSFLFFWNNQLLMACNHYTLNHAIENVKAEFGRIIDNESSRRY